MKLKQYTVHVSSDYKYSANAYSVEGAKSQAWRSFEKGWHYGWPSWPNFRNNVKVTKI